MRKRIYLGFIALALMCVVLLSALMGLAASGESRNREMAAVRDRAKLLADVLNHGFVTYTEEGSGRLYADYISNDKESARVTVIAPDGLVLLDNKTTAESMENHGNRPEFVMALTGGHGEDTRVSGTFGKRTYYYAVLLDDGNILRVSKTMDSIISMFFPMIPVIAAIAVLALIVSHLAARRLTAAIIKPLMNYNLETGSETGVYDELLPFLKRIENQKREIKTQLAVMTARDETAAAITGSMREGLILLDGNGGVLSANAAARRIFNESMVGNNIIHICRELEFQHGVRSCLQGVAAERRLNRGGRLYDVYLSPVWAENQVNGGVILFLDSTERQRAELQRREFSANVSHELKTPLTTISALSEIIGRGMAKQEDVVPFAKQITEQSNRLINVIEDIIRLSQFDENRMEKEFTEFDLPALARQTAAALSDKAAEKGVEVSVEGTGFTVKADRSMIDELIYNLLDNGIKYNVSGGSVTVAVKEHSGGYSITVTDMGIGIPPEHQSRVFERFYRVDGSRSKRTGGTGLGLSIVKHIAAHHGGTVELQSREGQGTAVTVRVITN